MRVLLSLFVVLLGAKNYGAPTPGSVPVRQSRQFLVVDARPSELYSRGPERSSSGERLLKLNADVLLLSAERIREGLRRELGWSAEVENKIGLYLYVAIKSDDLIGVVSTLSPAGWEYRIDIPDRIESQKLVRGIIHVLLLEKSNRGQGLKSAELPLWLVEGLTMQVLAVAGPDLVLDAVPVGKMLRIVRETPPNPPRSSKEQNGSSPLERRESPLDYLKDARAVLTANRPMSLPELWHPAQEDLSGTKLKVFQSCAHLLVSELLRTRNGPVKLVRLLRELPGCWNPETALLRVYADEFHSMLDLEKAWAVTVLAFTARDPTRVWTQANCLEKLDEILSIRAQVRTAADQVPRSERMRLQQVIAGSDLGHHTAVFQQKLSLLAALRLNAPPEVARLIDSYYGTLATYLQKRAEASRMPDNRMQSTLSADFAARQAVKELDLLDKRREALRPEQELSVKSSTTP